MNRLPFRGASQPAAWAMAFPFSETLSPRGAALLRDAVEPKTFPAGTVLLTEGETCEAALLVRKGKIRVYKTSPSGREITLVVVDGGMTTQGKKLMDAYMKKDNSAATRSSSAGTTWATTGS